MRRFFIVGLLLATALVSSVFAADRPNIVFIMSDDHCSQAVGAYGGRLAKLNPTPVIDTLAAEGVLFENCFVVNSICVPSRACIMTGQHNHINGCHTLGGKLPPERQYLAIEMRKAGYQTAMIGKWHLKEEPNFDYYKVLPGQGKYMDPTFRDKAKGAWPKNVVQMEGHSSDCITDSTLAWLKRRDRSRPFFLMHHYKAPHDFFDNAPRYEPYLADTNIPEPDSLWKQPHFGSIATRGHNDELLPYIGTSIGRRHAFRNYTRSWAKDPALSDDEAKRLAYQVYLKKYLRCVKGVDDNLKRLFDFLKAEGLYDNTVVVYTGDQGFMLGEHDYMDKRWMYDESQRMPFIVRYPKTIKGGTRTDAMIDNVDFAPTLLDFAGVPAPDSMQGRSVRNICESGKEPAGWKQAVYYRYWMHMAHHWNPSHFGIRTKTHKLIFYYGCDMTGGNQTPPAWELYDLRKDPRELNNVYDDPGCSGTVKELKAQLAALRREIKDTDEEFPEIREVVEAFWDYDEDDRGKAIQLSHDYAEREKARRSRKKSPSGTPRSVKAKSLPGGYFQAAPSKKPLRIHAGFTEISREATYRVSHPGNPGFNVDNAYLLSGEDPPVKPHAFHSAEDADCPNVVLKLSKVSKVRYIRVVNRKNSCQERAEGLTAWVSEDEKTWRRVWQAEKVCDEWLVDAGADTRVRFIKVGLPRKGTLHLSKITAFGE